MQDCLFCSIIENRDVGKGYIDDLDLGAFDAVWDYHPLTPGHMVIVSRRHAERMEQLDENELCSLGDAVLRAKAYINKADLDNVYNVMATQVVGTKAEAYVKAALAKIERTNRPPDAFNDGLNDGPAAGQTVPHFHYHVMPRWNGDIEDPRGGIRHMLPDMGNYHIGMQGFVDSK
jgi:histidine triad (HIT) family protein